MGKAKRFNSYDETVNAQRAKVKGFGQERQNLAGIASSFRSPPLVPPIATKIRGTGTGDGKFLTVSLSADQTANIAANNHVEFDTKDEDGGIVLQTGAGQADGIFELLGGRKYYLQASLRPEFSGSTGQLEVAWFDQTNSAEIGSRAKYEAQDHSGSDANQPTAATLVTPTTNIVVKLEILSVTALDALANEYCHANLFEISLGGFGAGGGGGGGGTITFPITPTIKDESDTWTSPVTIDLSLTTAHITKFTLDTDLTLVFSNPPSSGTQIEFEIEFLQDATGGRTVTFPASVQEVVSIATGPNSQTIVTCRTNDGGTKFNVIPALRGSISLSGNFANIELDNLANVAINTSLISDTDDTDDLGSASKEWKDLFIDGTANIDILSLGGNANFNDNEANNVKGIDFQAGGPSDTTTLPVIWADASGDLINNVATGDAFFWSIAGTANEKMRLLEAELQITTPNQNGPDLILTNDDQTPQDNDLVAQIFFKGNDDAPAAANWGSIEVEQNDVSAGAKQGTFKASCQSDNSLQTIIDYSGSDGVFRFSSGVDVVRPNRDDAIDLGASAQEWKDLWIDGTANIDTLAATTVTATTITMSGDITMGTNTITGVDDLIFTDDATSPASSVVYMNFDTSIMQWNVPLADSYAWKIDNVDQLTLDTSNLTMNSVDLDMNNNDIGNLDDLFFNTAGSSLTHISGSLDMNVPSGETFSVNVDGNEITDFQGAIIIQSQPNRFVSFSDGTRPLPSAAGAGAVFYSTTDGFLLYSDGTNWKNVHDNTTT